MSGPPHPLRGILLMLLFFAPGMRWRLVATRWPWLQIIRAVMLVGVTGLNIAPLV